mmetsp:Transcript_162/g.321  ORF Transcript_162/g.321 Transcript_162/m.321 type:complete len:158 (+) Transcript_162:73-546(+)
MSPSSALLKLALLSMAISATSAAISFSDTRGAELTASEPCYDVPGVLSTCGSHCWPNCKTQDEVSENDTLSYDFNHYLVIPEERACYLDTSDYGRYNLFLSMDSLVNITYDTYVYQSGVCALNQTNVTMEHGSFDGSTFCQVFMRVTMPDCSGCPNH